MVKQHFPITIPTLILVCSIFTIIIQPTSSQSVGFKCTTSGVTCNSLIDYKLPNTTTLSSIRTLFQIKNLRTLLAANNLPLTTPQNQTYPSSTKLKIPFPCSCNNDGRGISNRRPIYTVVPDDGLYHIAAEVFSGLVMFPQIQAVNNISDADQILVGQKLWVPLPCSCDDVGGEKVLHYGYSVPNGSSVGGIANQFNTTETVLLELNEMKDANDLLADSVLDVPLKVCNTSMRNDSMDYPLLVPNGTYTLTANNCVRCQCDAANNWVLQCEPSGISLPNARTCPSTQCAGTAFDLGSTTSVSNCNLSRCAYAGYRNGTILTTLTEESTCPAGNNNGSPSGNGSKGLRSIFVLVASLIALHLLSDTVDGLCLFKDFATAEFAMINAGEGTSGQGGNEGYKDHMFGEVYDDPLVELKNFKQTGDVQSYQDKFEMLLNKVDLSESQVVSMFRRGLKSEVGVPLRMFKPVTMKDASCLAKIQEVTMSLTKSRPQYSYNSFTYVQSNVTPITNAYPQKPPLLTNAYPQEPPILALLPVPRRSPATPVRKQLTQKELEEKRANNQCFYCDQRHVPGHKCSGQLYALEVVVNDMEGEDVVEEMPADVVEEEEGYMGKQLVHILIDSESTYKFLAMATARKLGCQLRRTAPLEVSVANRNQMVSEYMCKYFEWTIQGITYKTNVMVIPLGKRVVLRGSQQAVLTWLKGKKFPKKFTKDKAELSLMSLYVYPGQLESNNGGSMNAAIQGVLDDYKSLFEVPKELPPQIVHDHAIPLMPNTLPISIRPYKHPPSQKEAVELMVKELMDSGVIRDSNSLFSSPVVMVKKKDVIEELLDELYGAKVFSKLDLRKFVLGFFDDILIYNPNMEDHLEHLRCVLSIMQDHTLYAKQTKCSFAMDKGFLGLTGYYRRFIKNYAIISHPSTKLLKKNSFGWNDEAKLAFQTLKQAMITTPILGLPNFNKEFVVEIDACDVGIGAVLLQERHPIAYMSKALSPKHQTLSTYKKGLLAVMLALEK
nr:LysM domain-containing GPI-anchored protein 2 [Tanacetum cinerariifolium]